MLFSITVASDRFFPYPQRVAVFLILATRLVFMSLVTTCGHNVFLKRRFATYLAQD
ncbi:hypothetical protein D9M69_507480 [compost metagenome]